MINLVAVPVLSTAFLFIVVTITLYINVFRGSIRVKDHLFWMWLLGLVTFLSSILSYIMSVIKVFELIEQAGDISASMVSMGIRESLLYIKAGLIVFVVSFLFWGIAKTIVARR
jgi:hypothetical protein